MLPNTFDQVISLIFYLLFWVLTWGILSAVGSKLIGVVELAGRVFRLIPFVVYKRLNTISPEERLEFRPTRIIANTIGSLFLNLDDVFYRATNSLGSLYLSILESFFSPQESEVMAKVNEISTGNSATKEMLTIDEFRSKRDAYYYQLRSYKFLIAFLELVALAVFVFGSISSLKVFFDTDQLIPSFMLQNDVYIKILSIIGPFIILGFWGYSSPKRDSGFLGWFVFVVILFTGITNFFSFLLYRYIEDSTSNIWEFALEMNRFLAPLVMTLIASTLARGVIGILSLLVVALYLAKIGVLFFKLSLSLMGTLINALLEAIDNVSGLILFRALPFLLFIVDNLINYIFVFLGQVIVVLLLVPNNLIRKKISSIEPVEGFASVSMPDFASTQA